MVVSLRAWLLAALLLVPAAFGATLVRQDLTLQPAAAIPTTLAAGTHGSTTLGSSATSAATSVAFPILSLTPRDVLRIQHASGAWDVRLEATGASGFSLSETVTLQLIGASTQTQITVSAGNVISPITGTPVVLNAANPTITIRATTVLVAPTGTVSMDIVIVPTGSSQPEIRYPYTLNLG